MFAYLARNGMGLQVGLGWWFLPVTLVVVRGTCAVYLIRISGRFWRFEEENRSNGATSVVVGDGGTFSERFDNAVDQCLVFPRSMV
jgi:hypothetical protein